VRKICPTCIHSVEVKARSGKIITDRGEFEVGQKLIEKYFQKGETVRVYKGQTCKVCNHTGYMGRTGIFEVLEMSPTIKEMIMKKSNSEEINKRAVEEGMTTMFEDGLKKVARGITTIEEVMRAVKT